MSNIEKVDSSNAVMYLNHDYIKQIEDNIKSRHKKTQSKETNPNHIKQKNGIDYVEFSYMRNEVDENYPLWSLIDLKFYPEFIAAGWVVVQGVLEWIEDGVRRRGSHAAAHRIQFKSGQPRIPENIVDLGNDIKASVTDLLKKCFNTYLSISDDVYKNITIESCDKSHFIFAGEIIKHIEDESIRDKFKKLIKDGFNSGEVNSATFDKWINNLKRNTIKYVQNEESKNIIKNMTYIKSEDVEII